MDNFQRIRVVGSGSYGEVWLSKHVRDRKQYVLKKMDLQNASKRERKAAELEAKLLSKLKHPNIVAYKDSFETNDGYLWIAMGFCEGGDLYNHLKGQKGKLLEERQIVEWFVQISMALQYLHERNILHRDLKTQNIFLTKSKIIKLGDLGIARVLDSSSDMATTLIGTPYYMSPELFSNKPYNHKSDVWALGCCVYEMTTLRHAFNAKDMNSLVYKILKGKMPSMSVQYSKDLSNLIRSMLDQNPSRRPSVNKILRDPFIKKNIAIFLEGTRKSRRPSSNSSRNRSDEKPRSEAIRDIDSAGDRHVSSAGKKSRPTSARKRRDLVDSGSAKLFENPVAVDNPRPLPEVPTPRVSSAPKRSGSNASASSISVSSSTDGGTAEIEEAQRTNPNMSARARRRERSMREETPRNSYDNTPRLKLEKRKGSGTGERSGSTSSESAIQGNSSPVIRSPVRNDSSRNPGIIVTESIDSSTLTAESQRRNPVGKRQPSLADDDEDEDTLSVENEEDRDRKSGEKEMDNFVNMLDATLHMNNDTLDDEEDESGAAIEEAVAPPVTSAVHHVKSEPALYTPPMFSKETLNSSGRLMERIVALRKDCIKVVGLEKLHKAYQLLDAVDSDDMEAKLLGVLGQPLFDDYAGKIWQLKFCEESAFRIS